MIDLHLLVIDANDQALADLALAGQTLDEALACLGSEPTARDAPPLGAGGVWHREGWFGAVLLASSLVTSDAQPRQVEDFFRSAIETSRKLLDERAP